MNLLQNIIFPLTDNLDKEKLFLLSDICKIKVKDSFSCSIEANSILDLSTYFNSFNPRKWREETDINNFNLFLSGQGEIIFSLLAYYTPTYHSTIIKERLSLKETGNFFEIPQDKALLIEGKEEIVKFLAIKVETLSFISDFRASWHTKSLPIRSPKLAAVITTFQRQQAIKQAIEKFQKDIIPYLSPEIIELLVIDNGRELREVSQEGITVLHNRNLGGAGGFTRGIIEAKNLDFTHALLMDDDASCEPESVFRTYTLLSYFKNPKMAISGSMFIEDRPYIQHEKGGCYNPDSSLGDLDIIPLGQGLDLSHFSNLIENDKKLDFNPNFGAWWFFAFDLSQVEKLTLPLFVRGDDIFFSLANSFEIFSMNGIATWCEDFSYKLNVATSYLSSRGNSLISAFFFQDEKLVKRSLSIVLKISIRYLLTYRYREANAMLEGIQDAFKGPAFFGQNPDPLNKIKSLKEKDLSYDFQGDPSSLISIEEVWKTAPHKLIKRFLYIISLAGFFIPKKKQRVYVSSAFTNLPPLMKVKEIVHPFTKENLRVYPYSRYNFISLSLKLLKVSIISFFSIQKSLKKYKKDLSFYTSLDYWKSKLF